MGHIDEKFLGKVIKTDPINHPQDDQFSYFEGPVQSSLRQHVYLKVNKDKKIHVRQCNVSKADKRLSCIENLSAFSKMVCSQKTLKSVFYILINTLIREAQYSQIMHL